MLAGAQFAVKGYFDTRLPGQSYFGAEPEALAMIAGWVAVVCGECDSDAIAVMDTKKLTAKAAKQGMVEPIGFVPTEWMPMSMSCYRRQAVCGDGEGQRDGAEQLCAAAGCRAEGRAARRSFTYIATLLYGSLAALDVTAMEQELPQWTAEVLESNRMKAAEEKIAVCGWGRARSSM